MPPKGWKKPKQIVTTPPSPFKTRSGVIRRVSFSPQVDLQNDIQTASSNLNKMPDRIPRTPVGQVNHPLIDVGTPRSTSGSSLNSEDRITRGSLKKKLSFTPTDIVQHDGSVREREVAPLRVEMSVLDSLQVREEIEENVEGSSDEEDDPSLKQYEANINRAERTPFRQIMTQRTETISQEELEDQQLREALDSTHSIVKDIKARREQERRE